MYTHTHAAKGHAKAHWAWPNGMAKCANGMALVLGRDLETLEQTSYDTRVIRFKLIPPDSPMRGFFFRFGYYSIKIFFRDLGNLLLF